MPSLLITVFIIQLVIHLINTVGAKTINEIVRPYPPTYPHVPSPHPLTHLKLWTLYLRLPLPASLSPQHANYAQQTRLRADVVRLKREMAAVSAQDEFTRWAKLRRQHDKAMEGYDAVCTYPPSIYLSREDTG